MLQLESSDSLKNITIIYNFILRESVSLAYNLSVSILCLVVLVDSFSLYL